MIECGDYAAAKAVLDEIPEPDFSRRQVFIAAAVARSDAKRGHDCIATFAAHDSPLCGVGISDDGTRAASCDAAGSFHLWQIDGDVTCASSFIVRARGYDRLPPKRCLAVCPQLHRACRASRRAAELRDRAVLVGGDVFWSAGVNPAETLLAAGGEDGRIRIWELERFSLAAVLDGPAYPVNSLAWSPCGRFLLAGGNDRSVNLFDVASGKFVLKMDGHQHGVLGVTFGKTAAYRLFRGQRRFPERVGLGKRDPAPVVQGAQIRRV
jgi:WD40 repeat protein